MVKKTYCRHKNRTFLDKFKKIAVYQCNDCSLVFSGQQNNKIDKTKLYNKFYQNKVPARFRFGLEHLVRQFRLFRAFKLTTIYPEAKSILDIGSGRGFTLYYLKKYFGYKIAVGTQLCPSAVKYSREQLGLNIYDKDLLKINFGKRKFDLITMWHVLEHINQPEKYIKKMYSLLNKNGKILIEVPNYNSWTRKITKRYWLGMDLKYHLTFFTPKTLINLLKKNRLALYGVNTFSFEYSTFLSVQSLVSRLTKTDQLIFLWLQGKKGGSFIVPHLILFILLTPVCLLVNLLLYFSKSGEVLLLTARKRK